MNRALLPFLGWAICIATLSVLLGQCEMGPSGPEAQAPILTYAVPPDGKIRVPIQDPNEPLFLRAHLELPESEKVQTESTWTFGIRLTFHQPDGNFQSQDLWLRAGVKPQQDGSPTLVGSRSNQWVTEGRVVELNLQEKIRPGGQLEIAPLISLEGARLLLRLERQPAGMQMRLPWRGGAILSSRVSRYSALPWSALSDSEIEGLWAENRVALSADQLLGKTAQLHRMPPPKELVEAWTPPTELAPGQATGLTLQGPCSVVVSASTVSGTTLEPDWAPEVVVLRGALQDGLISQTRVDVPADAMWFVQWTAPANGSGIALQFEAVNHRACLWGQPKGQDWEKTFAPEARRFTAWSTDKGQSLTVPVATGSQFGTLTVEARVRAPAGWTPAQDSEAKLTPQPIRYTLLNEAGSVLRKGRSSAVFTPDSLAHRVEPAPGWMGNWSRFTVQHSFQATHLKIESDSPMDFRFLVPLSVEEERSAAYALPAGWVAQNAPWDLAPYVSLSPVNADDLLAEDRLVRFDATVRPVARSSQRPEGSRLTHKLTPKQPTQNFPMLEQVRKPGVWKPWHRTELGRTTRIKIPQSGVLQMEYRVTAADPTEMRLQCGQVTVAHEFPAVAGSLRLNDLPPGWQFCSLSAPSGRYVVNALGAGRRWAKRETHALKGAGLVVPVIVPKGGSSVFVRVYTPRGKTAPKLEVKVDNGRPRLRTGVVKHPTQARRKVQVRKSTRRAQLLDRDAGQLQSHQGLLVVLGDDLKAGPHTLQVRVLDSDGPVFVRFDSAAGLPAPASSALRNWYVQGETQ
jgi:hypothetical protein